MLCKCVMHIHGVQNKKKEREKKKKKKRMESYYNTENMIIKSNDL